LRIDAALPGVVLLPDESLQLLDLGLALDSQRFVIAEEIGDSGCDQFVEDVELHLSNAVNNDELNHVSINEHKLLIEMVFTTALPPPTPFYTLLSRS
jgi:hypothetical protein